MFRRLTVSLFAGKISVDCSWVREYRQISCSYLQLCKWQLVLATSNQDHNGSERLVLFLQYVSLKPYRPNVSKINSEKGYENNGTGFQITWGWI